MNNGSFNIAAAAESARSLANGVSKYIIDPILIMLFAAGLLVFVFGIVEYMWGLSTDTGHKENGKMHMLWGIVGMFIMSAAFAIIKILANFIGVTLPS